MTYKEQVIEGTPIWKNNMTYRLETIKEGDSIEQISMFLHSGIVDYLPHFAEADRKLSLKAGQAREDQRKRWLSEFSKVIKSLKKGTYNYEDMKRLLMDKPVNSSNDNSISKMNWLIIEASDKNSELSKLMKDNGLSIDIQAQNTAYIFFIKK